MMANRAARILHLHSSFDHGGKEARAVELMNQFGKRASHSIVSAVPEAMGAKKAIDKGIKVDFPAQFPSLAGRPAIGRYLRLAQAMKPYDLILTYNWGAMDAVMAHTLFRDYNNLPALVHHEDGFNQDETAKRKKRRNWFRMIALGRTHKLVVPSRMLENIALNEWKQPVGRIVRIPNGIDLAAYRKKPQKGAIPGFKPRPGEVVIGTVAGLRPVKNLRRMIRVIAAADIAARIVIVGDGPEREAIAAEAREYGLEGQLVMPGFLKDPARFIGLFDIFMLTSDSEQFPISLVEAMAAGCAVVASDVGDIRSMVSEENRKFIARPDEEHMLARYLAQIARDTALRAELAAANKVRASEDYSDDSMIARYKELYGRAMQRGDFIA